LITSLAAGQAVGRVHRDGAHGVLAKVLGDFEHQRLVAVAGFERGEDRGQFTREGHVDDSADDLADRAVGGLVEYRGGGHFRFPWSAFD
jgi:hypothetical protein